MVIVGRGSPLQNTGQDCLLCVPNYQDWPLASDGGEITDMKGTSVAFLSVLCASGVREERERERES